jgi:hypothetical protein
MEKSQFVESHIEITGIDPEVINTVVMKCEKKGFYLHSVTALNDGTISDGDETGVFGFSYTASVLLVFRKDQAKSIEFEIRRLEEEKNKSDELIAKARKLENAKAKKLKQEKIEAEKAKAEADKLAAEKLKAWLSLK